MSEMALVAPGLGDDGLAQDTAFRQAVTAAGGELLLAKAINVPGRVLSWWLNQGQPASYACIRIEDCTGVRCEDLRPDLYWLRIGEEVVGHVVPVDGADRAYVEAALRRAPAPSLDETKRAMIDGMLYGLDEAKKQDLLTFYRVGEPGVDVDLDELLHDVDYDRQDAAYFQAWGIAYALEDSVREELMRRYPVFQTCEIGASDELDRLHEEVDALRGRFCGAVS
jgi:DNA-binding transcriptional regulator YdaS (Cro superfamily)